GWPFALSKKTLKSVLCPPAISTVCTRNVIEPASEASVRSLRLGTTCNGVGVGEGLGSGGRVGDASATCAPPPPPPPPPPPAAPTAATAARAQCEHRHGDQPIAPMFDPALHPLVSSCRAGEGHAPPVPVVLQLSKLPNVAT